jgi:hypothetical protein
MGGMALDSVSVAWARRMVDSFGWVSCGKGGLSAGEQHHTHNTIINQDKHFGRFAPSLFFTRTSFHAKLARRVADTAEPENDHGPGWTIDNPTIFP